MSARNRCHHAPDEASRFWRLPAVIAYTQRSRSSILRDPGFPASVKLSANTVAWVADEVRAWADNRAAIAKSKAAKPKVAKAADTKAASNSPRSVQRLIAAARVVAEWDDAFLRCADVELEDDVKRLRVALSMLGDIP